MNVDGIYERMCRAAGRFEKLKKFQKVPDELRRNIKIARLNIAGEDVVAFTAFITLISGGFAATVAFASLIFGLPLVFLLIAGVLPIILYLSAGWYPNWRAEKEQVRGMSGAPRLLGYLAAKLKINPNIEGAARFAAEHTEGPLGEDLSKGLWKTCLRTHNSVEEALFKFSQKWRGWCEELSRSIQLMISSLSERDEGSRKKVLDQALEIGLQGTRERMESFAMQLKLPTTVIYGVGVLLPLVLLAVLPVLGSINLRIGGLELALIYCVVLPIIIYILEKFVLAKRPAAFPPPKIPSKDDVKQATLFAILVAVLLPALTIFFGLPQTMVIISLLWSLSLSITVYCYFSSVETYRVRKENLKVEREFCDALVQLGNHMKGGRPAEDAFRRASSASKGSSIAKVFEKASINLKFGWGGLRSAFFDPVGGALKEVYSPPIRSTLRMLIDVMERSTKSAGEAILQTAKHLERLKQVDREIRRSLGEIVSSMRSVVLFFAPLVAAVTVRLHQFLSEKTAGMPFLGGGTSVSFPFFLTVLGLYIVSLSILLSNYTVEIEWGDDQLIKRMTIAQVLPISMAVFTLGLVIGGQMLSFLAG